uniref:Ricin B lectin domain-containing protein n=1 Tax=Hevea brasiliensis TaxID=3981 RepID=I3NMQ8_HEVBR|nr:hypothetical protein 19 [Hevea brasiliensis]
MEELGSSHEKTESESSHCRKPHLPSGSYLSKKPSYKVYCKADPNFFLTIRDGKVVLAPPDPSDEFQHWYKDEKFSTMVKDEEGFPSFALVNKASGKALKHSFGPTHPVLLTPYDPDDLEASILWTESKDLGDGYRIVRMLNNIRLNVEALRGDKKSGGVSNGTKVVLAYWNKGDHQKWRIAPL